MFMCEYWVPCKYIYFPGVTMKNFWDLCVFYKIMAARADQFATDSTDRQMLMPFFELVNIIIQYVWLCIVSCETIYILTLCDCI